MFRRCLKIVSLLILAASCISSTSIASAAEPKRWALLVGVDDYVGFIDLRFCGRDARALSDSLRHGGFAEENLVVLHDSAKDIRYRPFKANVEKELDILLSLAGPDDLVIVSFSGHGMHIDGKSYLCPNEADDARPTETMIAVDDVYKKFDKCPAAMKLLLVDACRNDPRPAGRKSATGEADRSKLAAAFERPPEGIVVLASCAPGQISWEDEGLRHGVFMHHVLRGLAGEADGNKNGRITLNELYDFTSNGTKTYVAKHFRDIQGPAQRGEVNGIFEVPRSTPPDEIVNSLGMTLRLVPAGEVQMGSPPHEAGRKGNETLHQVKITKPFFIGAHEVTRGQFAEFVKTENYLSEGERDGAGGYGFDETTLTPDEYPDPKYGWRNLGFTQSDAHPVANVSWNDAQEFCRKLSAKEGRKYRLPTEAEWEYACRAGEQTTYQNGENPEGLATIGNVADAAYKARTKDAVTKSIAANDGYAFTAPVGRYKPNAFGLYDMTGNVWEWCGDWYGKDYYEASPAADPTGPTAGSYRVLRGGGWIFPPGECRIARRQYHVPTGRNYALGFRVVMEP
jgi:sulfatase modifying factor 1